jgi:hypothetical protein
MLDRMNKGDREEGSNERHRQITLHSFRRFVKTTISSNSNNDKVQKESSEPEDYDQLEEKEEEQTEEITATTINHSF